MAQTILILGGSRWQVDIIRRAAELGLNTLVTDIMPNPPGRALAHTFVQVDTNDRDRLTEIARTHGVSLVVAEQTDRVVPVAAELNERLGLPGIRPEIARRFTDKSAMRGALADTGIAMPHYREISTVDEAIDAVSDWGFPVVLKPKQSQSSLGVFKVDDEKALRHCFDQTLVEAEDGYVLVEEFIDGTEVTAEALSLGGQTRVLAISEKEHYEFNPCVARRLAYPPRFNDRQIETIRETAELVVDLLGLEDGISHAEYRVRDGTPYLVEVAARGGGSRIASVIVPHVSGVDCYGLLLRRLLGEHVPWPSLASRAANLEFLHFGSGRVKAVHGLDEVRAAGLVSHIELDVAPGAEIRPPTDDRTRHGYFIALGETREEIDQKAAAVKQFVRIEYY